MDLAGKRLAAYARRSRKEELRPGEQEVSTEQQLRELSRYVNGLGAVIPKDHIYVEHGVSAYLKGVKRGRFDEMTAAVAGKQVDGVAFWRTDRATRNSTDTATLEALLEDGAVIVSVTEGVFDPEQPEMLALRGLFAKLHSKAISVHSKRGKEALARSGKPSGGGRRRFGFEKDQVTIRTDEAELVREAGRRVLSGEGTNTVCRDWNQRDLRMPGGSTWQSTPLRRILLNPRTAGLRQHRGEIVGEATWDAILDRATWEQLRAVLTDPTRRQGGHPHEWLLSGIARCGGRCKGGLYGRKNARDGRPVYTDKASGLGGCNHVKIDAEGLESFVIKSTIDWLSGEGLDRARAQLVASDQHRAEVMERLQRDEAELRQLANLKATNRIGLDEWLILRDEVERRIVAARAELDSSPQMAALSGLPNGKRALQRAWKRMPVSQRRAILKAVIDRLVVGPAVQEGRPLSVPDRVTLTFRDRDHPERRAGWQADHDASVRGRFRKNADKLPHESDAGVLDQVARAMEEK
jgi:site-specific DNA recombinase